MRCVRRSVMGVLAPTLVVMAGCGGAEQSSSEPVYATEGVAIFQAEVPSADATFMLAEYEGVIISYLCGGDETYSSHTRWFCDEEVAPEAPIEIEFEGWTLELERGGLHVLTGTVREESGPVHEIEAAQTTVSSRSMLYQYKDVGGCQPGLIQRDDPTTGELTHVGAFCTTSGFYGQVTPLNVDLENERIEAAMLLEDGELPIRMTPVAF